MRQSECTDTIRAALFAFHKQIEPVVKKSRNPHFKSNYAKLEDVIDAVVTPLADNGMIYQQSVDYEGETIFVETRLLHEGGEWIGSRTPVLTKDKGNPQHMGSGITYARRYGLLTICCLPTKDDDGNAASQPPPKPNQQLQPVTDAKLRSGQSMAYIADFATAASAVRKIGEKYLLTSEQKELVERLWTETHTENQAEEF